MPKHIDFSLPKFGANLKMTNCCRSKRCQTWNVLIWKWNFHFIISKRASTSIGEERNAHFFKRNAVLLFNRSALQKFPGEMSRFDATFEGNWWENEMARWAIVILEEWLQGHATLEQEAWGFSEGLKKGINFKLILKTLALWPLSGKTGSSVIVWEKELVAFVSFQSFSHKP